MEREATGVLDRTEPQRTAGHAFSIDLHAHTTASDGTLSPVDLVQLAGQRGISVLGITDHDTLDGIAAARQSAADRDIEIVPGVELSTTVTGAEIHILGYFVDEGDSRLVDTLAGFAGDRRRRIEKVIARLRAAGIPLDAADILRHAENGSIGRPHVARALVKLGVVATTDEAFERYLKKDRPGWVPREPFSPEDAVGLLANHGAIPVLAHPFSTRAVEATVKRLIPAGLRGIEVHYGQYTADQRRELESIADAFALLSTGGSDYHGPNGREGRDLGSVQVPEAAWQRLRQAGVERGIGA
ncbi:MAG: FIG00031715: Predicted metal-dependent phosphoesterases (PHP family) [uncultured Thermomicrobiales bacterium]|uniref:FIG00031715: Predicted metal-dependent phosphoesterases (PHP family) n=1 Tax=uncultured Thermomicrobiales bacterium TaxID=1645740 RepID=A0A6J4UEJ9_9BACT|nr:MAG: FIG00031715: Predicted metal-dependent phosphoesterases (PHP family) [uncultured Thermomicrobiales bacterium]